MADGQVLVEFKVVQKGSSISLIQKDTEKLAKSTDKATNANKRNSRSQETVIKGQKGIHQGSLSSAKGFSKMNQMLGSGGSSGLVAAYATLAANVFAASAAFLALKNAAQFAQLEQGLVRLGAQSGRTLSVMAEGLRDVTGGALSAQQAMTGAALGVSGGFGAEKLEGLAKIARGASITLGRDLADAFDRLTRGAIKLEPEILDELGIMVRLDDAVDSYAATLGKASGAMSQAERRQAFMNAILEQGEAKFGAIADKVDPTVYDKLGATFADLTKDIFQFVNEGLQLNKVIGFLADNTMVLAGVMVIFGSTIVNTMLPGLANAAVGASQTAASLRTMAAAQLEAAEAAVIAGRAQLFLNKNNNLTAAGYVNMANASQTAVLSDTQLIATKKTLQNSLRQLTTETTRNAAIDKAAHNQKILDTQREIAMLETQILLEQNRGRAAVAASVASAKANSAEAISDVTTLFTAGAVSFGGATSSIFANMSDEIVQVSKAATSGGKEVGNFGKAMIRSSAFGTAFMSTLRLIGATLLSFALPIGIAVTGLGLLFVAYNKAYNTKEFKAYLKGQDQLNEIFDQLKDKAEAYTDAMQRAGPIAGQQITTYSIIEGTLTEINEKVKKQIKLNKEAAASRGLKDRNGVPSGIPLSKQGLTGFEAGQASNRVFNDTTTRQVAPGGYNPLGSVMGGSTMETVTEKATGQGGLDALLGKGAADFSKLSASTLGSAQDSIASIFEIKDSDGVNAFRQLLGSEIPNVVTITADSFQSINDKIMTGATITEQDFSDAINKANTRVMLLGQSAASVNAQLKAGEKQAGSFMRGLSPKTAADDIIKVVDSIIKEVNTLSGTVQKTFATGATDPFTLGEIGKSLSATGNQMAKLMGADFQADLEAVRVAEKSINDTKKEGGDISDTQQSNLDKALQTLGGHTQSYKDTSDVLKTIQRQTIERKTELKAINSMLKQGAKFESLSVKANELQLKATNKRLEGEKEINESYITLAEGAFSKMDNPSAFITSLKDGGADLKSLLAAADAEAVSAEDVFTFRKLIAEQKAIALEIEYQTNTAEAQGQIAAQKAIEQKLKGEKELFDLQQKGILAQVKLDNFSSGGGLKVDPIAANKAKVDAAREARDIAVAEQEGRLLVIDAEATINKAKAALLKAQMEFAGVDTTGVDFAGMDTSFDAVATAAKASLRQVTANAGTDLTVAIMEGFNNASEQAASGDVFLAMETALAAAMDGDSIGGAAITAGEGFALAQIQMSGFSAAMEGLGPEGEKMQAFIGGMSAMTSMVQVFGKEGATAGEKVKAISGTLAAVGSAIMASSKAQSAEIQNQIDMEEKRDGKSAKSLGKIKALKAKQTAIERKAFEQNKKIQLANAVINGLAAIQSGFATQPFFPMGLAMGGMALAMTAMQIKAIQSQSFQGGAASTPNAAPSTISVGKRDNKVNTSQGASSGELAYLRGQNGVGSNANNFRSSGAAGMKSYASGGEILVGERGPEVVSPTSNGYNVIPNDKIGGGTSNVNFTINAVDAAGVQELLVAQRGNIIGMIREAANEHGEEFMESVNTNSYGGESI